VQVVTERVIKQNRALV